MPSLYISRKLYLYFMLAVHRLLILGLLSMLLGIGCKKEKPSSPSPSANCPEADTATITYTNYVAEVMRQHCTSCHGGNSPSKGIALETYQQVRASAETGKWYQAMANGSMPPSGKLDDCTLAKLKKWIDSGYPQ